MRVLNFTFLFIFSFIFITNSAFSQEQLTHKKKIYRSPEGKLYVNKDLPIYFRIATSDDDEAESFLLNPAPDSKKYANPMYLDTEGYNTFRSPSKVDTVTKKVIYPLEDIIYQMYSDSRAPITKFSFDKKKYFKSANIYYFGEIIDLKFSSSDATSGVEKTYYSMNGAGYVEITDNLKLDKEVLYEIKYYSVDHVGNAESPKSIKIKIDITKPSTKLSVDTDLHENIISPRSKIVLEASDNNSKVKKTVFSLNGGTVYNYNTPIVISGLKEGEHSITYYSTDNAGNVEAHKVYDFYLDKSAPLIVDEFIGNTFIANGKEYSSGRSKVKLTAMDNKAGVKEIRYSINGGEFMEYTKPFFLSKSGKLKIQTFVTDNVNNQKITAIMTNKSAISYVDLSGPTLGHYFQGPNFNSKDTTYITKDTKIKLAAKDDASGFSRLEYSLDNESIVDYEKAFSIGNDGVHVITYSGYDFVDNSSTNTFTCVEDNVGPEIFFRFSILSNKSKNIDGKTYEVFPNHVVLFLSSTDSSVGFEKISYSVNGAAFKPYTSLIKGFTTDKLYSIKVKSGDKLGNVSEKTIDFYIE
ncbi:MAG: hypothetical protein JEY96_18765 [Bacteroidales bacterium]|nr:hypothetical protein [Bacteroidales bacterium]